MDGYPGVPRSQADDPFAVEQAQSSQDVDARDDAEAHDDRDLGPADDFEVVVKGRNSEDAPPGEQKLTTWMMTDRVMMTKSPPKGPRSSSVRVRMAKPASAAPGRAIPYRP